MPGPSPARGRVASYRIQLRGGITLDSLVEVTRDGSSMLDDLVALGVSDLYLSPVLTALPGSTHGYDVVDPSRVDPDLGGDDSFARLSKECHDRGLSLLVDIVPNHMAADAESNRWWWDVLANGPSSRYADHFDIDWESPEARLRGRILLPILPDHIGREIDRGAFELSLRNDELVVEHPSATLPLELRSCRRIIEAANADTGGLDDLVAALDDLPPFDTEDRADVVARREAVDAASDALADALRYPASSEALARAAAEVAADPDQLDAVLVAQPYRLARWQAGLHDLVYRRFFDITGLVALRQDRREVFDATHAAVASWLRDGLVEGLRVDHPDGLRDPSAYLSTVRRMVDAGAGEDGWLLVEKILEPGEDLPPWPVDGTTGYEVADLIARLHLDDVGRGTLIALATEAAGAPVVVEHEVAVATRQVLEDVLAPDLGRLAELLLRLCERRRRFRDVTRPEVHDVLAELIAAFPVYRLYTGPGSPATEAERAHLAAAVARAERSRPDLDGELLDLVATLVADGSPPGTDEVDFQARFHQLTGPAKAKGQEDTAGYRVLTLLQRNEVGADLAAWSISLEDFHDAMARRQERWPRAQTTLATHDSKRSADVRARLAVLSEDAERWATAVERWCEHLERSTFVSPPDKFVAYYTLQTIIGSWPIGAERLGAHVIKALREAKLATSWLTPDESYEAHAVRFVESVLDDRWLTTELEAFVGSILRSARLVALSQTALQLTVPGVPDLYQGSEWWSLTLVDPDNRSPIDLDALHRAARMPTTEAGDLDDPLDPGAGKVQLIRTVLALRARRRHCFDAGSTYEPLYATGPRADHAVAFARGVARSARGRPAEASPGVVVVAVRRVVGVGDGWSATRLALPAGRWRVVVASGATRRSGQDASADSWAGDVDLDNLIGDAAAVILERVTDDRPDYQPS